jgi:hypothetical protein
MKLTEPVQARQLNSHERLEVSTDYYGLIVTSKEVRSNPQRPISFGGIGFVPPPLIAYTVSPSFLGIYWYAKEQKYFSFTLFAICF